MSLKPSILTVGKFEFYAVSEHGMSFVPETPRGEWLEAVKKLLGMHEGAVLTSERTLMLLADALNHGEKTWPHEFAQAIDGTRQALGLSPKTIANAQWVYGKIEADRRCDGLTLGHYSVVAALEPETQDRFIREAIKDHMTVSDLKEHVAEHHPKTSRGKKRKTKAQHPDLGEPFDTEGTIQDKLSDCANWFMSNSPTEKMKDDLEALYKTYRRKWASGRRSK